MTLLQFEIEADRKQNEQETGLCLETKETLIARRRSLGNAEPETSDSSGINLWTAQHGLELPVSPTPTLCWRRSKIQGFNAMSGVLPHYNGFFTFLLPPWCRMDARPCQPNHQHSPADGKFGEFNVRRRHGSCSSRPYILPCTSVGRDDPGEKRWATMISAEA